jgi:hypothetical protein
VVDFLIGLSRISRVGKSVVPIVYPKIQAFACKRCSSIASVSLLNNKITINRCNCR